jgi:hypothetical protein
MMVSCAHACVLSFQELLKQLIIMNNGMRIVPPGAVIILTDGIALNFFTGEDNRCLHIVLEFFVLSVMINSCFIPCNSRLQKLLSLPGKRKELS